MSTYGDGVHLYFEQRHFLDTVYGMWNSGLYKVQSNAILCVGESCADGSIPWMASFILYLTMGMNEFNPLRAFGVGIRSEGIGKQ